MIVTLNINKQDVLSEVQQTTNYVGVKMDQGEAKEWERVRTIDEDESQLRRFYDESTVSFTEQMKKFLAASPEINSEGDVSFTLEVSSAFDRSLTEPMQKELFSFYVMNITGKWFALANKAEAQEYIQSAASLLEGVHRKACWKKKPIRPTYD